MTQSNENDRKRTIVVDAKNTGSFGFTIQSYGIHYPKRKEIEVITYVDYVAHEEPAFKAGMRPGDVILTINGDDVEGLDHKSLVEIIKNSGNQLRMMVLFENCVHKVELHMKYINLQNILQAKLFELNAICEKESHLLSYVKQKSRKQNHGRNLSDCSVFTNELGITCSGSVLAANNENFMRGLNLPTSSSQSALLQTTRNQRDCNGGECNAVSEESSSVGQGSSRLSRRTEPTLTDSSSTMASDSSFASQESLPKKMPGDEFYGESTQL